jgi:hypothetical protein
VFEVFEVVERVEVNSKISGLHQNKIPEIFFVNYHTLG